MSDFERGYRRGTESRGIHWRECWQAIQDETENFALGFWAAWRKRK